MHLPKETFFRLRDEKQESILRSAIHEFVEHGFERAKVCEIAKNAHVATGSIYQYFADKEELFMYCAQWGFEIFMEKMDMRMDIKSMDIFEYFNDRLSKTAVLEEEREIVLFMQELSRHPDMMYPSMREMYTKSDDYIIMLIQNSKEKGLVRTDIDDEILKEYFTAVTERFKMRWMEKNVDFFNTHMETGILPKEINEMMELLKHGLSGNAQK
jgi:AcrR family transcriptional regulator